MANALLALHPRSTLADRSLQYDRAGAQGVVHLRMTGRAIAPCAGSPAAHKDSGEEYEPSCAVLRVPRSEYGKLKDIMGGRKKPDSSGAGSLALGAFVGLERGSHSSG